MFTTAAERIRAIRLLEMMEKSEKTEKLKDGTMLWKDDNGNVILKGKNIFKKDET